MESISDRHVCALHAALPDETGSDTFFGLGSSRLLSYRMLVTRLIQLRSRLNIPIADLTIPPPSPALSSTSSALQRRTSGSRLTTPRSPNFPSPSSASFVRPSNSRTSTCESTNVRQPSLPPPTSGGMELDSISSSNAVSASSSSSNLVGMVPGATSVAGPIINRPSSGSVSSVISLGPPATGSSVGNAGQTAAPEVERRLSFGQPHYSGGRVAETGTLRRAGGTSQGGGSSTDNAQ